MLSLWLVTDGKAGDRAQVEGVALAIAGRVSATIEERRVAPRRPWAWLAPWGPADPNELPGCEPGPFAPPLPDLVIATGRRAVPVVRAFTRLSGRRPTTVFLKDPRTRLDIADLVWAPAHDGLPKSPRLVTTPTGPHRFAPRRIAGQRTAPDGLYPAGDGPRLGIVLGGPSKGTRYDAADIRRLADHTRQLGGAARVAVVGSRRTPEDMRRAVADALPRAVVWNGAGDNPYGALLAHADALLVTGDSHNMVSEALAFGVPVHVFRPARLDRKLDRFLAGLSAVGLVRESGAPLATTPSATIDATPGIADAVLRVHAARTGPNVA